MQILIIQQQAATLKLNNLKLIAALPKLKINENGKVLMDITLRVLMPMIHWNDKYEQRDMITNYLHDFVLKDIFEDNFYRKYILKAVFLSERAVLFKLTQK